MTKMSPDDARCIIWALGELLLFFFIFFATNKIFIALPIYKICDRGVTEGDRPKQAQTTLLASFGP